MKFLRSGRLGLVLAAAVVLAGCTIGRGSQSPVTVTEYQPPVTFEYGQAWDRQDCLRSYAAKDGQVVASAAGSLCRELTPEDPMTMQLRLAGEAPDQWYITVMGDDPAYFYWTFRSDRLQRRCAMPDCTEPAVLLPGGWAAPDAIGEKFHLPANEVASRQSSQLGAQLAELKAENQALYEFYKALEALKAEVTPAQAAELQAHRDGMASVQAEINELIASTEAALGEAAQGKPSAAADEVLAAGRKRLIPAVKATVCTAAYAGC